MGFDAEMLLAQSAIVLAPVSICILYAHPPTHTATPTVIAINTTKDQIIHLSHLKVQHTPSSPTQPHFLKSFVQHGKHDFLGFKHRSFEPVSSSSRSLFELSTGLSNSLSMSELLLSLLATGVLGGSSASLSTSRSSKEVGGEA